MICVPAGIALNGSVPQLLMDSSNLCLYGPGGTPIAQVKQSSITQSYLISDSLGSRLAVAAPIWVTSVTPAHCREVTPESLTNEMVNPDCVTASVETACNRSRSDSRCNDDDSFLAYHCTNDRGVQTK
jgi:hypothetical protein